MKKAPRRGAYREAPGPGSAHLSGYASRYALRSGAYIPLRPLGGARQCRANSRLAPVLSGARISYPRLSIGT